MKKSLIVAASIIVAILVASCCPCRKATNKSSLPLKQTEWRLIQIEGRNIAPEVVVDGTPRIILADDGSFGGYGGCNSLGGSYRITPSEVPSQKDVAGKIELGNVLSTKRMCPNDRLEQEFFGKLATIDSFTIDGNQLFLFSNGELKLLFEAVK